MHHVRASAILMSDRLPRLRAYLTQAKRMVNDPSTDAKIRRRMSARIERIEADLASEIEEG